jgi:hypothetical protein
VKVELELEFDELTNDGDQSVIYLHFNLVGKSDCIVGWIRHREKGKTASQIRIHNSVPKDGKSKLKQVRTQSITTDMFPKRWAVEYRHGLIHVSAKDRPIVIGHIDYGTATVKGIRLHLKTGEGRVSSLSVSGSAPSRKLTADEQKQLDKATKLNS